MRISVTTAQLSTNIKENHPKKFAACKEWFMDVLVAAHTSVKKTTTKQDFIKGKHYDMFCQLLGKEDIDKVPIG